MSADLPPVDLSTVPQHSPLRADASAAVAPATPSSTASESFEEHLGRIMSRLSKAHRKGRGVRLSADDLHTLYCTPIMEGLWDQEP